MLLLNLLDDMFFAAIPAVGFALVFNVPPKALKYCAILGALGHVTRTLLLHFGIPIVFATFFATCVIGFIGVHLSHRYLAHPKVFTVAAIIPMIPGVHAYNCLLYTSSVFTLMIKTNPLSKIMRKLVQHRFSKG